MAKIDISNVITVTLLSALRGLQNLNTSVLALFTDEEPVTTLPDGYGIYRNPTAVANDWGSTSDAYTYANRIFSQTLNPVSGGGYLVIIPLDQTAAASAATLRSTAPVNLLNLTGVDYEINAAIDGGVAADLTIGELDLSSVEAAETSLNSTEVSAAGVTFSISGDLTAATITLASDTTGATSSLLLDDATTGTDIAGLLNLQKGVTATGADAGVERVKDAILRTAGSINYFGIILNQKLADAELTETAALMQGLDKLLFVGSNLSADVTGIFTTLKNAGYTHTRCLYYSISETKALEFAAGYAGRGLSVNFDGVNTAQTMHLKEITGMIADTGLTETLLNTANRAGVDVYADFGVPKLFTSGANEYFDFIYMQLAFKNRLQIAGFNFLATTNTKIPQTETGMNNLKNAYREVCKDFVENGSFAPGTWNDATTFGNPEDHRRNIADFGYYIYSVPITEQSQLERESRVAPAVYIAGKSAGAIHKGDVVAFIEK